MKVCAICRVEKSDDEFFRCNGRLHCYCKPCDSARRAQWRRDNNERANQRERKWASANAERMREASRRHYWSNKEKHNQRCRAWRLANLAYDSFRVKWRKAMIRQAIPSWADIGAIKDVYEEARHFGLHVDHIVPLTSKLVCGLHVWDNLQLIPQPLNAAKGNRWWPDKP